MPGGLSEEFLLNIDTIAITLIGFSAMLLGIGVRVHKFYMLLFRH